MKYKIYKYECECGCSIKINTDVEQSHFIFCFKCNKKINIKNMEELDEDF